MSTKGCESLVSHGKESQSTNVGSRSESLTPESSLIALKHACRSLGIACHDAELVRLGENAMYRLNGDGLVARIGRSAEASRKEARVARWLASHDFPAARLADDLVQPVVVEPFCATFWEFIDEAMEPADAADLGRILRDLHAVPSAESLDLPGFRPMPKVEARLDAVQGGYLTDDDIEFVRKRHKELEQQFSCLKFEFAFGPIHGDAHTGNLMRDASTGSVRLIDFEDFAWGPREWDASVASIRHVAFGWESDEEYRRYIAAYGWDPITWSGFPVFRAIRELNMTTWLMQLLGQSAEIDAEVQKRVRDLRDQDAPRDWHVF